MRAQVRRERVEGAIRQWLESPSTGAIAALREMLERLPSHRDELREALSGARQERDRAQRRLDNIAHAIAELGHGDELAKKLLRAREIHQAALRRVDEIERSMDCAPSPERANRLLKIRAAEEWMKPGNIARLIQRAILHGDRTVEIHTTTGMVAAILMNPGDPVPVETLRASLRAPRLSNDTQGPSIVLAILNL